MEITRGMLDVLISAVIWSFFLLLFKAGVHVKFVFDVVRHGLSVNISFTLPEQRQIPICKTLTDVLRFCLVSFQVILDILDRIEI